MSYIVPKEGFLKSWNFVTVMGETVQDFHSKLISLIFEAIFATEDPNNIDETKKKIVMIREIALSRFTQEKLQFWL